MVQCGARREANPSAYETVVHWAHSPGCIVGSGIDRREHHPLHHATMLALDAAARQISSAQANARHNLVRRHPHLRANPRLATLMHQLDSKIDAAPQEGPP